MIGSATLQGHLWGGSAHTWAEMQEPLSAPLWQVMLDVAGVGPGTRLLDAGCGAGGASLQAAQRGALVNGVDASEALLAIARGRVPDGDFRVSDLELLPFAGGTFDAVIAADVLPYTARPAVALQELARVSRREAPLVVAIGGTPYPVQQAIALALRELLPACGAGQDPFALSGPGVLDALLAEVGLRALAAGEVHCPWEYADRETAWQAQASTGPLQAAVRLLGRAPVRAVVLRALAPYAAAEGAVRLVSHFRYIVATPHRQGERETERRTCTCR
jgi:SAM-dependent methyltransferase